MESSTKAIKISLRCSQKPTEKFVIDNIEGLTLQKLKEKIQKEKLEDTSMNLVFLSKGQVVPDDADLKAGSIYQVIAGPKRISPSKPIKNESFNSEVKIQEVVARFRSVSHANYNKASKPEFLEKIFTAYPNLRNNLTAVAFLKDPTLLSSIGNPETVRRLAEAYPEILEASKLIVDTLNSKSVSTPTAAEVPLDDLDSDSSSEESSPSTSARGPVRITSNQLAQALGQILSGNAGISPNNSLANISQRNLTNQSSVESPTPSSAPASASGSNRVTSSMFMNALSEVLRSTRSNNEARNNVRSEGDSSTSSTTATPVSTTPAQNHATIYASQLQQMREMGLQDTDMNLQALIVTNGDLEAAINIVFSGGPN